MICSSRKRSLPHLQGRREHRIRAVPMRPQLDVRSRAEVGDGIEQRAGVDRAYGMTANGIRDDADRFGKMRRTRRVQHHPARAGERDGRSQQFALKLGQGGTSPG